MKRYKSACSYPFAIDGMVEDPNGKYIEWQDVKDAVEAHADWVERGLWHSPDDHKAEISRITEIYERCIAGLKKQLNTDRANAYKDVFRETSLDMAKQLRDDILPISKETAKALMQRLCGGGEVDPLCSCNDHLHRHGKAVMEGADLTKHQKWICPAHGYKRL